MLRVCLGDFPSTHLGNIEINTPYLGIRRQTPGWYPMGGQHSRLETLSFSSTLGMREEQNPYSGELAARLGGRCGLQIDDLAFFVLHCCG
jgi:hypothetical protein